MNNKKFINLKKAIRKEINNIEVDISEMQSAKYDYNIFGVERQLAKGGWYYDPDEEWEIQKEKFLEKLELDHLCNIIELPDWLNDILINDDSLYERVEGKIIQYVVEVL